MEKHIRGVNVKSGESVDRALKRLKTKLDTEGIPPELAPTPVLGDNKSVEFAVNNPETSQRTRHIETRYFKIRDYVQKLWIRVRHIGTDFNVSDFFTKALARVKFQEYRNYLGMEDHAPL